MNEALVKTRMVCRDEQYMTKAIIYFSLKKYSELLRGAFDLLASESMDDEPASIPQQVLVLLKDFTKLHKLFSQILLGETFYSDRSEMIVEVIQFDSNVTCSFCRANIFNRFLTCHHCVRRLRDGTLDT